MMRSAPALLLILLACCSTPANAMDPLRVSWGPHNAPPYAILEREQLTGGIIHDVGEAIARKLGTTVQFVQVPRARYEAQLIGGRIDMTCITQPQWLQDPQALTWSPPLFEEVDVLAQSPGTSPWRSIEDLEGRRIGTIHSYTYPSLEGQFASGRVRRDDGGSLDGNMRRLALGRLDAVLDAEIPIRWWLRENRLNQAPTFSALTLSTHPSQCAISPRTPAGAGAVRAAFTSLIEEGKMRRILSPYVEPERLKY